MSVESVEPANIIAKLTDSTTSSVYKSNMNNYIHVAYNASLLNLELELYDRLKNKIFLNTQVHMKVDVMSSGDNKFIHLVDYNLQPVEIANTIQQIRVTFDMNKNVSSLFDN